MYSICANAKIPKAELEKNILKIFVFLQAIAASTHIGNARQIPIP
jgi:hypothetical protein|tara:strand:+ start:482 stop:616 length:135 start_codon:yes stop_codon:yes gene_type:complete